MSQITVYEVRSTKLTEITVSGATLVFDGVEFPVDWIEHERHFETNEVVVSAYDEDDVLVARWSDDLPPTGGPMPSWLRAVLRGAHCRLPEQV